MSRARGAARRFPMLLALALAWPRPAAAQTAPAQRPRPNILLVLLDDIGVDKLGAYGLAPPGTEPPCTPNIDALAAEGLLFTHAWANPVCSPTRAQILTGRHGFRTGIGTIIEHQGTELGLSATLEVTLPEILAGYDNAYVGKWHLAHPTRDGLRHAIECGFQSYAGTLFNISTPPIACGPACVPPDCAAAGLLGYSNWVKVEASAASPRATQTCVTTYATSATADDAIARAAALQAPWFLEVSFNAAHLPAEQPPAALAPAGEACARRYRAARARADVLNAMVSALDTELGRMLAAIRRVDPGVVILLLSDNGTSIPAAQGPARSCFALGRSKGSLYEGGIRVPLIVAGPNVARGRCDALVSATDLFATIAELAGVPHAAADSVSLVPYLMGNSTPRRATVYAELFRPNFVSPDAEGQPRFAPTTHTRALRNTRFKLIRALDSEGAVEELFFDLANDPCEEVDLLVPRAASQATVGLSDEQRVNLAALRAELEVLGVQR